MLGLHLERVSDITQTPLEASLDTQSTLMLPITGQLTAKNIAYRYSPNDPQVFSELSFDVDKGEFVALFGPSGVGKTTLLKVLIGLANPEAGEIEVDGISLRAIGHHSFRRNIAAIMQNDTLFSGSIRENVVFFDSSPDLKRVQEVCEQAQIHAEIVMSPMGYDSLIGDMGSSLSGGQQQRILMARALYQNPKILFLDEGTAHVDATTEQQIMDNLKNLGLTCIYVTHNPALLSFANKVIEWVGPGKLEVSSRPEAN